MHVYNCIHGICLVQKVTPASSFFKAILVIIASLDPTVRDLKK